MQDITQTYTIKAPVAKVWQALTDAKLIEQWHAGPAEFDATVGGTFSLWGGDIHGTNTAVVPNERLEQDWYGHDHPDRRYRVHFVLKADGDHTVVELLHKDVPADELHDFAEGWREYYFDPITELLEGTN